MIVVISKNILIMEIMKIKTMETIMEMETEMVEIIQEEITIQEIMVIIRGIME